MGFVDVHPGRSSLQCWKLIRLAVCGNWKLRAGDAASDDLVTLPYMSREEAGYVHVRQTQGRTAYHWKACFTYEHDGVLQAVMGLRWRRMMGPTWRGLLRDMSLFFCYVFFRALRGKARAARRPDIPVLSRV